MRKELHESCCLLRSCHPAMTDLRITRSDLQSLEDIQEISDALKQNDVLKRLNLNCLPQHTTIIILKAIRNHETLDELIFSHCRLGGELAEVLPVRLRRLALNCTNIGPDDAENLARCIRFHIALSDLRLSWTNIGTNGARLIGDSLIGASLKSLYLVRCNIGDSGAVALSHGLSENVGILELWLEENEIGPVGAVALARASERHPTVREIWLYKNRIGNEGGIAFGRCLGVNSSIMKLNLDGNKIDAESVLALADGLSRNKTLLHLWLPHNSIRDCGAIAVRDAMRTNTTLRRVDGIMSTRNATRNIRDEIYFCLDLNRKGWRKKLLAEDFLPALWSYVFGVLLRKYPDAIYFFLRDKPDLICGANRQVDL